MKAKHIAVMGAGLAGLATTALLLKAGERVTLHDPRGIAGGASGIAPGLLHPYPGRKLKRYPDADAYLEATRSLMDLATAALGTTVIASRGIIRLTDQSPPDYPDLVPVTDPFPGVLIQTGFTLHIRDYLQGLWLHCSRQGAKLLIDSTPDPSCDLTIWCTGGAATGVRTVKGQLLQLQWPADLTPPPHSLLGQKYLVMRGSTCLVGATYENTFTSPDPDPALAKAQILPYITTLYPALATAPILACHAGIRAYSDTPILQLDAHNYQFAGLGSHGLLTHALLAHRLVQMLP